jgi:hypothetical protein
VEQAITVTITVIAAYYRRDITGKNDAEATDSVALA